MKRLVGILLSLVMAFTLCCTACAAVEDTGFSDVAADAWYEEAVAYVRDNGIMGGTSETALNRRLS